MYVNCDVKFTNEEGDVDEDKETKHGLCEIWITVDTTNTKHENTSVMRIIGNKTDNNNDAYEVKWTLSIMQVLSPHRNGTCYTFRKCCDIYSRCNLFQDEQVVKLRLSSAESMISMFSVNWFHSDLKEKNALYVRNVVFSGKARSNDENSIYRDRKMWFYNASYLLFIRNLEDLFHWKFLALAV